MGQYDFNPAWVDRVVGSNYEAIVARVGIERAPRIASKSRSGKIHFEELGCGHYGCVMPTETDDVVFKVTSDASEAAFVSAALSIGAWPDGLIRYYDIFELAEKHRGRRVFGLVRQEAYEVGGLVSATLSYQRSAMKEKYEKRYGVHSLREFDRSLRQWLFTAGKMREQLRRAKNPDKLLADAHTAADRMWHVYADDRGFEEQRSHWGAAIKKVHWYKGAEAFELRRILLERLAAEMANTHAGYLVGEALGFYLEKDILLADVHMGNIGEAAIGGYTERELVITDPGHMVPLEKRWLDVAVEQLAA